MEALIKEKFVTIYLSLLGVFVAGIILLLTTQDNIGSLFILGIGTFIGLSIPRLLMKKFNITTSVICWICGILGGVALRLLWAV